MKLVYLTAVAVMEMLCVFTFRHDLLPPTKPAVFTRQQPVNHALIRRGEYLVTIMGCADCHSPKKLTPQGPAPDMDRFLSGYDSAQPLGDFDRNLVKTGQWVVFNGQNTAFAGPWGVSFAANLTPDASGIGAWSLAQFSNAMRKGKNKGLDKGRPLLPPMPWPNYTNMSEADMKAVFTYLKSLKPVANVVPAPLPPAP